MFSVAPMKDINAIKTSVDNHVFNSDECFDVIENEKDIADVDASEGKDFELDEESELEISGSKLVPELSTTSLLKNSETEPSVVNFDVSNQSVSEIYNDPVESLGKDDDRAVQSDEDIIFTCLQS